MKSAQWLPGMPAKKSDLDRAQRSTQEALRERWLDLFTPGVLNNSQLNSELQPFYITPDSGLSIKVGTGIAIGPNKVSPMTSVDGTDATNTGGERVFIPTSATTGISGNNYANSINGGPGTGTGTGSYTESTDGLGGWTATPQTTGTRNIPLVNGSLNYVWCSYLQCTDVTVTSLHEVTSAILYPSATDGYEIIVNQSSTAPGGDARWIRLGIVDLTSSPGSVTQPLINQASVVIAGTQPQRVNFTYNPATLAPLSIPTPGTSVSLETMLNAKGTGVVTVTNIFGLSLADIGFTEDVNLINHEHYHHSSGLVVPSTASTTSALYPQIQAGGFGGSTYTLGMKQLSTSGAFPEQLLVGGLVAKSGVGTPVYPAAPSPVAPNISTGDPYVGFSASDSTGTWSIYVYINGTQPTAAKTLAYSPSADTFLVCTVSWNGSVLSALADLRVFGTVGTINIQKGAVGTSELATTAVTPGTYGTNTQTSQVTVGIDGRVTSAANVVISGVPAATVPAAGIIPGTIVSGVNIPAAGVIAGTLGSGVIAQNANSLNTTSAGNPVVVSTAAPPSAAQILTASSATAAVWSSPASQIPVGTTVMYAGNVAPAGWLICDGSLVSNSTYSALYAALNNGSMWGQSGANFNLPDFRGIFPRGANNMGGSAGDATDAFADPDKASRTPARYTGGATGNAMGSYQQDAMQGHIHQVSEYAASGNGLAGGSSVTGSTVSTSDPITDGVNGAPRCTSESRAKNAYIMFVIKY